MATEPFDVHTYTCMQALVGLKPGSRAPHGALHVRSVSSLFSALVSYLEENVGVAMPPNQRWYCILQVFFNYFSFLCSGYVLIAMTFERFYSIVRPLNAASFNTVKRARIIIISIFLLGFSYCVPFFVISGNDGKICIVNKFASDNVIGEIHYWLTEFLSFIFPFLSLLTMNSVIIHTLKKRSLLRLLESEVEGQNDVTNFKMKHSEKQICTMLLLVTFAYLILNILTRALILYLNVSSGGDTPYYYAGFHLFYQIGDKSSVTNHGINFFLYAMSGQKFRTDLRNLFSSKHSNRNKFVSKSHTISSSISSDMSK